MVIKPLNPDPESINPDPRHCFLVQHYLNCPIGEMHDDGFGGSNPALDLWNNARRRRQSAANWRPRAAIGRRCRRAVAPARRIAALGEILVHVLGKVAEQDDLLLEGGRHLVGGQVARAAASALTKLNVTEREERGCGLIQC